MEEEEEEEEEDEEVEEEEEEELELEGEERVGRKGEAVFAFEGLEFALEAAGEEVAF